VKKLIFLLSILLILNLSIKSAEAETRHHHQCSCHNFDCKSDVNEFKNVEVKDCLKAHCLVAKNDATFKENVTIDKNLIVGGCIIAKCLSGISGISGDSCCGQGYMEAFWATIPNTFSGFSGLTGNIFIDTPLLLNSNPGWSVIPTNIVYPPTPGIYLINYSFNFTSASDTVNITIIPIKIINPTTNPSYEQIPHGITISTLNPNINTAISNSFIVNLQSSEAILFHYYLDPNITLATNLGQINIIKIG
jgi:hypothetical protein